jgi:two-component system LytT family response regulator
MTAIRTLIVDDEPLARDGVRLRLAPHAEFQVVGECGNGEDAVEAVRTLAPDLVFLDVQMPGLTGFEVLEALGGEGLPEIVFVTAYDQYAIRAFDVHALDYVLKPFDDDRFGVALCRVRRRLAERRAGELGEQLAALLATHQAGRGTPEGPRYADRLVLRDTQSVSFVRVDDVDWVEADGDYMRLHTGAKSHLLRSTMADLERKLDPRRFARIHRSTIVQVDRIREMRPSFHGEYVVVLRCGTRLKLSRSYRDRLSTIVGEI